MAIAEKKPKPKRTPMDNAQNSVLVKLISRVDKLSAIVDDRFFRDRNEGTIAAQSLAKPVSNNAASPPNPSRTIPGSINRIREAMERLREYRELHASVYGPVIMPSSIPQAVGPSEVNQLSNCEVSCILNEFADQIFAITADLQDMATRTQL